MSFPIKPKLCEACVDFSPISDEKLEQLLVSVSKSMNPMIVARVALQEVGPTGLPHLIRKLLTRMAVPEEEGEVEEVPTQVQQGLQSNQ